MDTVGRNSSLRTVVEIAINLGLIFILLAWCLQILRPFMSFIVWGGVIAIATYTPFLKLKEMLGGRQKPAVLLFALIGVTLVIGPVWLFSDSIIAGSRGFASSVEAGHFELPAPTEKVKTWPVVGKRVYKTWSEAATNLQLFLKQHNEQLKETGKIALKSAAGTGLSVLQLLLAIVIAAFFLANAEKSAAGMRRLFERLVYDRSDALVKLSVATIRSVAVGVLGIAFIQATLGGIGMVIVGVPGAGLWTLFILVIAVAQLPPWLVLGPVIVYVFSVASTPVAVAFMIWSLAVSFADMALKPLLLGRGVEAPMLVILLGALGGMILSGIIGLFLGAVVLAVGYQLLQIWLADGESTAILANEKKSTGS